ncbi:type VII secretion target [Micromonospora aurantiaca]|uniref:type VII secretion target n=1 Tax=Micromonospora aurantiaca (nom. illeg.) TaxID=47850 RepID=UPI002E178FAD|nr:type VII secretion target [Micromonospora aurantiaca]
MVEKPFDVDPELLRSVARELADDAYRLGRGPGAAPESLLVAAPDGWRSAVALTELESAVRRWSGALGAQVADTAQALRRGADGYEAVDERAARRLTGVLR